MSGGIREVLWAGCLVLATAQPTYADSRSFSELLAKAKQQAAEGHRWAPPGDNMSETVMGMMDLLRTATPAQVAELSALLERDKTDGPNVPPASDPLPDEQPVDAAPVPTQAAPPAPAPPAPAPPALEPSASAPPASAPVPLALAPSTAGQSGLAPSDREPTPVPPPNSNGRPALLFSRGLEAELRGDISGARRFYLSAAQLGDAAAARNLGRLYDPAYIRQTAFGGIDADPAVAQQWYERAVRLGDAQAGPLLQALSSR